MKEENTKSEPLPFDINEMASMMDSPGKNSGGSEYTKHQSTRAERKMRRKMQKASRRANR